MRKTQLHFRVWAYSKAPWDILYGHYYLQFKRGGLYVHSFMRYFLNSPVGNILQTKKYEENR